MLIRELFKKQAEETPDGVAVVYGGKETTWREMEVLANGFAWGLMDLGVRKGDRVASLLTNSLEFLIAYMALMKCGAVFVPLNFQLTGSHLRYVLEHSEAKVLLCDRDFESTVREVLPGLSTLCRVVTVGEGPPSDGMISFQQLVQRGADLGPDSEVPLSEEDVAIFLYTAGTTGDPKGVVHTHFNCAFVVQHWARVFRMAPNRTTLLVLPLFHAFALHCVSIPALISGTRLVIAKRYRTRDALEYIQKYQVQILSLVPAMANMIINHEDFEKYDLSSLDIMLVGGAIVPYELLKRWREAFPDLEIINGYGQTESCPCCTGLWDVDILEKPRSVGKPWPVVELKILDEKDRELPPGQVGEIVYKVPSVMKEYYKEPALTAETVRNGWLYSGDLGYRDDDGYVYIVDRKKDIIIRGGENISSMEVEEVLHQHPGVLEASVIGAPDPVLGETVMAVVVRKPGSTVSPEDLVEFCKRELESFKVPTRVEFVDQLPRNPGGKVLKRELKAKYFG